MKTKICTKCKVDKALSEFGKNRTTKDGLRYWCKTCRLEDNRSYRQKNKEAVKEYRQRYYLEHRDEIIERSQLRYREHYDEIMAYREEHREEHAEQHRRYRQEHAEEIMAKKRDYEKRFPERIKAQEAVKRALKSGKLIRPDRCSNPKCNCLCKPDGHHWNYLKEHWLDVEWLCRSCHKILHIILRKKVS